MGWVIGYSVTTLLVLGVASICVETGQYGGAVFCFGLFMILRSIIKYLMEEDDE